MTDLKKEFEAAGLTDVSLF
ncbi:hypothetical protein P7D23_01365 [Lactococcus petauri]|uniref:Uncharacterized protein n=1 Tax=Lactococcus petauri TaxID=1940789 RepID=A0AAJ2IWS2_9LACT|nr:hypothetical protein [Lactococcus petauri]MCH1713091.1 hypothetical protein [Lactococcus petauri]MDT2526235.1 hypothetical protein [Lactococcus petauri]MDT2540780.1 hypothetical protein [Lactococcus petauri]MDT2557354.1 hypothetical protein [Lactococcus petauri]MDT2559571.1 hypothetical protein [Lactococcus petauri]